MQGSFYIEREFLKKASNITRGKVGEKEDIKKQIEEMVLSGEMTICMVCTYICIRRGGLGRDDGGCSMR